MTNAKTIVQKSPYPYFGGKSKVAAEIWERLGDVPCYVEPFLGSAAVFLARPEPSLGHIEAVNDKHGFIPNFWRAIQADPEQVARYASYPQFECDVHARHAWLVNQSADLQEKLEGDPGYFDAKIAGWWIWGICLYIGTGWCSGDGPWKSIDGILVNTSKLMHQGDNGQCINRQLMHQGDNGQCINRQLMHQRNNGQGINRQLMHQGNNGRGDLLAYFEALKDRFHKGVRVNCGGWKRVLKPAVAWGLNDNNPTLTGIVLDPPYSHTERKKVYSIDEDIDHEVRQWALDNGSNLNLRIAYCTYTDSDTHRFREAGWQEYAWKTPGGYAALNSDGRGMKNRYREAIFFSPHCISQVVQRSLFS